MAQRSVLALKADILPMHPLVPRSKASAKQAGPAPAIVADRSQAQFMPRGGRMNAVAGFPTLLRHIG
ncbi:hypothetical protein BVG79_01957 [Ketogulonicigenium robustum]|uniref:Uncharacterized protein n=1 Tax=Ketogulonicigenium robustum TaxID=92947 RepID=A0A1W6P1J3_9RHOB|nr:hypothetical protein BVG79_01957 [Ketogulonicigenium robustum]